jgi:hypothetical protein
MALSHSTAWEKIMQKFLGISLVVLTTTLTSVTAEAERRCEDDHRVRIECPNQHNNYQPDVTTDGYYNHGGHHHWNGHHRQHYYSNRDDNLSLGEFVAGALIVGIGGALVEKLEDDNSPRYPTNRKLDLAGWEGAFKKWRQHGDGTWTVSVYDTSRQKTITKRFNECRKTNNKERRNGYNGVMCRGGVSTTPESVTTSYDDDTQYEPPAKKLIGVWQGPYAEGGKLSKPSEGDNGTAYWWARKDDTTYFFKKCRPYGNKEEGMAECRGKVTGLQLSEE